MSAGLAVVRPGSLTTIQDLGRPKLRAAGISPGGAEDTFAHAAANLLVGNPRSAPTLECTINGPALMALRPLVIAVTGADMGLSINGHLTPGWTSTFVAAGELISLEGRTWGARAYLAVAGGFTGEKWLGSMSTHLLAGRGGHHGRALRTGDELEVASHLGPSPAIDRTLGEAARPDYASPNVGALAGPHMTSRTIFESRYRVSALSDRMGARLEGPPLPSSGGELLSFPLAAGCVQAPKGGEPILLLADHPTCGGYPVIATVATACMPRAAQLAPGDEIGFEEIDHLQARALAHRLEAALLCLA
ncbi:MAG TPA: biotin-dependent carboxyltransferase family protein [Candidatus Dormibacteraeota bacterium]|nr:biotin-dependent carboxyltransferase family protein [Candidatus Dormibacteraeota bacterium]